MEPLAIKEVGQEHRQKVSNVQRKSTSNHATQCAIISSLKLTKYLVFIYTAVFLLKVNHSFFVNTIIYLFLL